MSAQELKEAGNKHFGDGEWSQAKDLYTQAIALDPHNAVLFSNRSAAALQLAELEDAVKDADKAIELNPSWDKGYYRKGCALEAAGKDMEALAAYRSALERNNENGELHRLVRKMKQKTGTTGKEHKRKEKPGGFPFNIETTSGPMQKPRPSSWARGLSIKDQYEWLCDCYRMRIDDEMVYQGNLRGLYDMNVTDKQKRKVLVIEHFLVFCKLAKLMGVLPPEGWDWKAFLMHRADNLPYAFEKDDAKQKWGGENYFSAFTGGRSLRATGETIYGTQVVGSSVSKSPEQRQLDRQILGHWRSLLTKQPEVFDDVGGKEAWEAMSKAMPGIP
mmetsp:Transcript_11466/g.31287  ORF Transcript_11466/g.31287 Transcript_11466/m.31287 type:complete len:331 (+) Transcript_11466:136-1128(+)